MPKQPLVEQGQPTLLHFNVSHDGGTWKVWFNKVCVMYV